MSPNGHGASSRRHGRPQRPPAEIMADFEQRIQRHEDLLYGIALFFEGIHLLLAGQVAVIETYRKQYRNIIRRGNKVSQWARTLLKEAVNDSTKAAFLPDFNFDPCRGHPDPAGLLERAEALVESYKDLFPNKPRDKNLTEEETLQLIETASLRVKTDSHPTVAPPP